MRRFYAFLIMVVSILAVVVFNIQGQYELFGYGLEYSTGTEITYLITPNEDNQNNFDIQNVAKIFNNRLEDAGAKDYYVYAKDDKYVTDESNSVATYQITVRLAGLESEQTNILRSVENYGKFWLTSQDNLCTDEGEDIVRGSATIEYNGSAASVVVETTDKFKENVGSKLSVSESSGDEEESSGDTIILWSNYIENTDSYEEANKSETIEQKKMQDKIIAVLDASSFNKDTSKLTISSIGYVSSGTSTQTLNASSAHAIQRILNSDLVDFEIERLHIDYIEPQYGNNASLLIGIASIAIVLIACVLLIVFYGINGVAGSISLILSMFLSVVLYNSFALSITPTFVISIISSLVLCMVILSGYFSRFKNELYRGRMPSKANKDSFKENFSTSLDATIFTLISMIILALLARNSTQNYSLFLIMNVIVDFLVCLFVTRLLLYFISNSKIANNKKIYRVREDLIPDLAHDEEQKYFGAHEKFDSLKHQKKSLGITLGLSIVSLVTVLLFSFLPNTSTFAYTNEFNNYSLIQIVDTHGEEHFATKDKVNEFFEKTLETKPYEIQISVVDDPNDIDGENEVYYVNAKFNLGIDFIETHKEKIEEVLRGDEYNFELTSIKEENVTYDSINYFVVTPYKTTDNLNNAMLLIGVMLICTIVYCFIRFRYTFALSSILTSICPVLITTGILSLTRIPVSPNMGIALLASVLITTLLEFIVLVRYSKLRSEVKNKVITLDERIEFASVGLKRSISSLLILTSLVVIGSIVMLVISPIQMYSLYLVTIIGTLLGLLSILFVFVPVYKFSETKLRIKFKKKKTNKKKKVAKVVRTSKEVEEVIIPGIND